MERRKWSYQEVEEYRKAHSQYIFYFNKEDANFLVPKMSGIGRTNNWAHPISWLFILAVIAITVVNRFAR